MSKAALWKDGKQQGQICCQLCSHFCTLHPGETGKCGIRVNDNGTLLTLVADRIAALNLDPVEKKPLYHFLPGSQTLSLGTVGCNFSCKFCQNHGLSQDVKKDQTLLGRKVSPQELVNLAVEYGAKSISYTYSEPTIFFELMQATAQLAKEQGLKNIMVSNGFMSLHCLQKLSPLIDAINVDLKAFSEEFYDHFCQAKLKPVLYNLKKIKSMGWWLEVTTLLIPGVNDNSKELQKIARFITQEIGPDTPWHISRFHPAYQMPNRPPTPVQTLEEAYDLARSTGLHFVYLGNVPGHPGEHTLCPHCQNILIRRQSFSILENTLDRGTCPHCKELISGYWD